MWLESTGNDQPVPGEWILARMAELKRTLRESDGRWWALAPQRFMDPLPVYQAVERGDHRAAVALMCDKYGLDSDRVELNWSVESADEGVAGHVHCDRGGPIVIGLRPHYRREPRGFGTVLAHELGHAYLTDMDVENGGTWEGEATTDLVTLVKGLGKLTVNGVDQLHFGQKAGSRAYGYLNREGLVFAYARAAREAGLTDEEARAGLNPTVLGYLNVLDGEPGLLSRLLSGLRGLWRAPAPPVAETEVAVDAEGNLVDARTGRRL